MQPTDETHHIQHDKRNPQFAKLEKITLQSLIPFSGWQDWTSIMPVKNLLHRFSLWEAGHQKSGPIKQTKSSNLALQTSQKHKTEAANGSVVKVTDWQLAKPGSVTTTTKTRLI